METSVTLFIIIGWCASLGYRLDYRKYPPLEILKHGEMKAELSSGKSRLRSSRHEVDFHKHPTAERKIYYNSKKSQDRILYFAGCSTSCNMVKHKIVEIIQLNHAGRWNERRRRKTSRLVDNKRFARSDDDARENAAMMPLSISEKSVHYQTKGTHIKDKHPSYVAIKSADSVIHGASFGNSKIFLAQKNGLELTTREYTVVTNEFDVFSNPDIVFETPETSGEPFESFISINTESVLLTAFDSLNSDASSTKSTILEERVTESVDKHSVSSKPLSSELNPEESVNEMMPTVAADKMMTPTRRVDGSMEFSFDLGAQTISIPTTAGVQETKLISAEMSVTDEHVKANFPIMPSTISPVVHRETFYASNPVVEPNNDNSTIDQESAFAEPGPDWTLAKEEWREAWFIHLYLFGLLFALLAVFSLSSIIRLWNLRQLLSKSYFITLNALICVFCTLRAVYLLVDGYNSNETFAVILDHFLYSSGSPCLTSAFSVLFFALLQATKMQLLSQKIQSVPVLLSIIIFHFCLSILTDVVVGLFSTASIMLFVCQLFFLAWGSLLFVGFIVIFARLYKSASKHQQAMSQYTPPSGGARKASTTTRYTLCLGVKITLLAAVFGIVMVGLEIYGIVGVYQTFTIAKPQPWPWWVFHTALRFVELAMGISICYVASQPFRYPNSTSNIAFYCSPCRQLFCQIVDKSGVQSSWGDITISEPSLMSYNQHSESRIDSLPVWKKLQSTFRATDILPLQSLFSNRKLVNTTSVSESSSPASASECPIVDAPAIPRAPLLLIEDGFIRFTMEEDNAIYDKRDSPHHVHDSDKVKCSENVKESQNKYYFDKQNQDAYYSSGTDDIFQIPSSINLAQSIDKELEKSFCNGVDPCISESIQSLPIMIHESCTPAGEKWNCQESDKWKRSPDLNIFKPHVYKPLSHNLETSMTVSPICINKSPVSRSSSNDGNICGAKRKIIKVFSLSDIANSGKPIKPGKQNSVNDLHCFHRDRRINKQH